MCKKTIKLTTLNGKEVNLIIHNGSMIIVGDLGTGDSFSFDTPTDAMLMRDECEKFVRIANKTLKPPKDYEIIGN